MISHLLDGNIIHAPVQMKDGLRMLDVGCGTGVVTDLMAQKFPMADCIGLDLSQVPANLRARTPRVRFFQGNILTEKASQWRPSDGDDRLPQDSQAFDYVYSRLLILGMSDWPGYIQSVFDVLKPNGWMEIHDPDWVYFKEGQSISDEWPWLSTLRRICENEKGMDFHCGSNAAQRMRACGFHDVQVIKYPWPYGGQFESDPRMREFSLWHTTTQPEMIHKAIKRTMLDSSEGGQVTDEQIESMRKEARASLEPQPGKYQEFYVTVGRKPA